jgi:hypothetical protein
MTTFTLSDSSPAGLANSAAAVLVSVLSNADIGNNRSVAVYGAQLYAMGGSMSEKLREPIQVDVVLLIKRDLPEPMLLDVVITAKAD